MKPSLSPLLLAFLLSCLFAYSESTAQSVSPFHIFNTGLNMGFLSAHVKNHTGQENYGVWAGNASAEWIESWEPGAVNPISPDLSMPSVAHDDIISNIMQMGTCMNLYTQIFRLYLKLHYLYLLVCLCPFCKRHMLETSFVPLQ